VILVDVNLLLYAYDSGSSEHRRAALWLRQALEGTGTVGLSWETILGFLRITTDNKIRTKPLELHEATAIVNDWLARPNVALVSPAEDHWAVLSNLLPKTRVRGSLIMDAHLAALAIEHGATLCTNDRDFARFPGLRVEYPLQ
jgi:toxin-antitoxin system PIN domain toxin